MYLVFKYRKVDDGLVGISFSAVLQSKLRLKYIEDCKHKKEMCFRSDELTYLMRHLTKTAETWSLFMSLFHLLLLPRIPFNFLQF